MTSKNTHISNNDRVSSPFEIVSFVMGFTMFFSAMSVFVKLSASAGIPVITIMFFRFLFGLLPVIGWLAPQKMILKELFHKEWIPLLIRTVMGMMAMWCTFMSFKMLPVAEATVLHFASPLFLTIFSIYFLSEHVGKWRWGAIFSGFIGVIIVLNPSFSASIYGQIIAICAAIIMALNMTMVRSMAGRASPQAMTIFMHVTGTLIMLPLAIYQGFMPSLLDWPYLILAGICAGMGQIFLNQAYMNAPSAFVSSFGYIQIIFVTLAGYIVFGDVPTEHFILGSSIIVTSGIVIAVREYLLNKKSLVKDMP